MKKRNIMLCACLIVSGCALSQIVYIAKVPLPQTPVFTVIPTNLSEEELQLATWVQNALIKNRMQVIEKPPMIMREHGSWYIPRDVVDIEATLGKINADLVVIVNRETKVMKIIKKDKSQILVSSQINCHGDICWNNAASSFVENALKSMGLANDAK